MRRVLEDLLMEGFGARAGAWLERYERDYGPAADHAELVRQVAEVAARGEPTETVADLLARPRATPEELRAHLGSWNGESWSGDGPRQPIRLRLWVEDGTVRGELAHERGPTMGIEYLRLRPDGGLEFGYKNGMRPRGLLVYSEERAGGTLEGQMEMRGVRFVPPDGRMPPRVHFELARLP